MTEIRGFVVAAWLSGGSIYLTGRLEDGRSFAAALKDPGGALFVAAADLERAAFVLDPLGAERDGRIWADMSGRPLSRFACGRSSLSRAERALASAGVPLSAIDRGGPEEVLAGAGVSGGIALRGEERPGRRVDVIFVEPRISGAHLLPPLRWLALDIETDRDERVVALSLADADHPGETLFLPVPGGAIPRAPGISVFESEGELLLAFARRLGDRDPDVVTGWNVVDFDLRVLASRFAANHMPFALGRSDASGGIVERAGRRLVADLPGRAVVDAMRLHRASGERYEDQRLETVARNVLGEGKIVAATGGEKLAELERLRRDEPEVFCRYCLRDSELVLGILHATGLDRLTQARAALTGLPLDLAWTSIPAFERVYAKALRERLIVPPPRTDRRVSGAAGGTVLDPEAGLFDTVLVFDFRSLYPSVMRSFNVDPLAFARAEARPPLDSDIVAPNGARFDRAEGVLPSIIAGYAAEREAAIAAGDDTAAYVYKILQNSFYGVLGAEGCRYARTELAGAITSFGKKFLLFARDFFEGRGYHVLYGDTDSVFVQPGAGSDAMRGDLASLGDSLAETLNQEIAQRVIEEYGLGSFLRIRCEKVYRRFFIPRLRLDPEARPSGGRGKAFEATMGPTAAAPLARGRAKGYAGLLLSEDGSSRVEVKGMEAARSDWTPLARRFQMELLSLVFGGAGGDQVRDYCLGIASAIRKGELDAELVYRKTLRRPPEEYATETPQVRAARLLGIRGRRGTVNYVMTVAGAEPASLRSDTPIDYTHYLEHQLLPIARAVTEACAERERIATATLSDGLLAGASWNVEAWFADRPQMEFEF